MEEDKTARAKERISKSLNDVVYSTLYSQEENEEDEKILLSYINRLESKVEEAYYNGYIQRQNEAMEICKICKYKAKANKYDSLVENMKKLEKEYEEELDKNSIKAFILKCQVTKLQELLDTEE